MKKAIFTFLIIFSSTAIYCQDDLLVNKNGVPILPQKGDISIGIDAVPFLNMLNNKGVSPGFNFINNVPTLAMKIMLSDQRALRMELMSDFYSATVENTNTSDQAKVTDSSFGLGMGYEWRDGNSRVQGFYGVQGAVFYGKEKDTDLGNNVIKELSSLGVGLEGFIGVELFVIPKLSIGGQFKWGPTYVMETDLVDDLKGSIFGFGTDNMNGALMISFYF